MSSRFCPFGGSITAGSICWKQEAEPSLEFCNSHYTSQVQTYARPLAVRPPKAVPKPAATQITVTPTVGSQASAYTPAVTGRMQRMKTALGIEPARITNHYPTVGVTFGSARRPYAEVTID